MREAGLRDSGKRARLDYTCTGSVFMLGFGQGQARGNAFILLVGRFTESSFCPKLVPRTDLERTEGEKDDLSAGRGLFNPKQSPSSRQNEMWCSSDNNSGNLRAFEHSFVHF